MKLHLPSDLRHAVMACITALCGIAATSATGTLAIGAATVALASTALAETYTPDSTTHTISNTLQSGDVINLSGNSIGTSSTPATLNFAANNSNVTLNATSGTCTWNVNSNSYGDADPPSNDKRGVSTVNVYAGATLDVYNTTPGSPAFNNRLLELTINLKAGNVPEGTTPNGGILCSKGRIFGWSSERGAGARKLNMENGSKWNIELDEFLNNTTVVMDHATIQLASDKTLCFERFSNAIKTESTASGMSLITGGKLKVGGGSPTSSTIDGHSGILFEIQRGSFDATNTADLRIVSALQNGGGEALLKSGNGVLELTNANSDYTEDVYVTNGTLKLGGANGQAGRGTITVDTANAANRAILELAHSGKAATTNRINLDANATLKVTGSQETIGGDSSLLGTVALSHTLLNIAAITLGETTRFDLRNWDIDDKTGATPITLISGGTVSGYEHLSAANIDGWDGGTAVFSWANGALLLASETVSSTNVYWNPTSTDTVWTDTTQFNNRSDGTGSSATAGSNTIVFNTGTETTLTLGSDIANAVHITSNTPTQPDAVPTGSTLRLAMGNYNLTGEVTVDSGSTLEIKDDTAFSVSDHFNKPGWNGAGTIILKGKTGEDANHSGHISLTHFNGTVQVSGKFDLGSSAIGSGGTWHLKSGEAWSDADATIANNVTVDNFVLRPNNTYTFTGVVTGETTESTVTIGYTSNEDVNNSIVKFSNAASNISKVNVVKGTVVYNGSATGGDTLFTGDTYLAAGTHMTLAPSDNANATSQKGARQYKGKVYLHGTYTVSGNSVTRKQATLTFEEGSVNIENGLYLGETNLTTNSNWDNQITVSRNVNHFINGLYGTGGILTITRNNANNDDQTGYIALTGSGNFAGKINIGSNMGTNTTNFNFGIMVLGETNSTTALQHNAIIFNGTDSTAKTALVFTTSDSVIAQSNFTNGNFQSNGAANGALAGLGGGGGAVYAKELTLRGSDELTYNGDLCINKLIVDRTGKQTLAGDGNYNNMNVEVKNGTLAFSGNANAQVNELTLTSNLEVNNGGTITIGSTTGNGKLTANAGSIILKGTSTENAGSTTQETVEHQFKTLDLSNGRRASATVTVQKGGTLKVTGITSTDTSLGLWSSSSSSILLEEGAQFIADMDSTNNYKAKVTISGKASATDADKTKVHVEGSDENTPVDARYTISSNQYTISNATVTVDSAAATTIGNKLLGGSLINAGAGEVTTTNGWNNLTKIEANGGNINLQNVGTTTPEELHSLVIGADKTVGAHTDASSVESVENEATLTVSDVATFGQGATLNANLVLKTGVTLTLDGALQMGSTLTLNEGMTLSSGLLAELNSLGVSETLDLFTGVDTLTLGDVNYTMRTNILSKADGIDLNTYFSNVQAGSYYLGYNEVGTVYAGRSVPEPATTTLGLLALVALCARRRRRQ